MPNTREKLIEKINTKLMALPYGEITLNTAEEIADSLIEDGYVTNTNVGKWISVKDRLPEQGQEVIVYSGGVLKPTVFAYQFWNKNYDSWARITHWMPLPEPPKGE